jgi:hypothetical protein
MNDVAKRGAGSKPLRARKLRLIIGSSVRRRFISCGRLFSQPSCDTVCGRAGILVQAIRDEPVHVDTAACVAAQLAGALYFCELVLTGQPDPSCASFKID